MMCVDRAAKLVAPSSAVEPYAEIISRWWQCLSHGVMIDDLKYLLSCYDFGACMYPALDGAHLRGESHLRPDMMCVDGTGLNEIDSVFVRREPFFAASAQQEGGTLEEGGDEPDTKPFAPVIKRR